MLMRRSQMIKWDNFQSWQACSTTQHGAAFLEHSMIVAILHCCTKHNEQEQCSTKLEVVTRGISNKCSRTQQYVCCSWNHITNASSMSQRDSSNCFPS